MGKFPSLSECDPGFDPVEYNVVILPEPVEEKVGSIILIDKTKEADHYGQFKGMLVGASPLAFNFDTWPKDAPYAPPSPGNLVYFAKHSARVPIKGPDGREYWMMKDKEVAAIIRAPELSAA